MKGILSGIALFALASAPALSARELEWREITVQARVEADGSLLIHERQSMVFTGDWNGGERRFRLEPGQHLDLLGVVRIDPASGAEVALHEGSLSNVDNYAWAELTLLRWRSRAPSDPEFDHTEMVYRLDYRLRGIFTPEAGLYRFANDFLFADRSGPIQHFTIDLALAPEWEAVGPLERHAEGGPLPPGAGYVIRGSLRYVGGGEPASATPLRLSTRTVNGLLGAAIAGMLILIGGFVLRDLRLGRFAFRGSEPVDTAWLETHLFDLLPEEAGALWDRSIGSAEVAATLARLVQEGKLSSRVEAARWIWEKPNLHLVLRVQRDELEIHERVLINAFFPKITETDMRSLRKHYARVGFDPAGLMQPSLRGRLIGHEELREDKTRRSRMPGGLLLAAAAALLVSATVARTSSLANIVATAFLFGMAFALGARCALAIRPRVRRYILPALGILVVLVAMLAWIRRLAMEPDIPWELPLGVVFLSLAAAWQFAEWMKTQETRASLVRRLDLCRARAYLAAQLRRRDPKLEDSWFPYFLAFGLARKVDRWFRHFGAAAAGIASTASPSGGSFASAASATADAGGGGFSSAASGWTGGGGAFGGAGATATWAVAATTIAAGVSSPRSSGGSSGGGGGGSDSGGGGSSSSGGGGGGGW
ncbi:MAG: hypothetical protein ABI609_18895 [Acidobacteriota bacterium]